MRFLKAALAAATLSAMIPSIGHAQQGTPAFRVPIGESSSTGGAGGVYAWTQSVGTCSNTCGTGTRSTTYQCQNVSDYDFGGSGYGAPEPDAMCTAAKPSAATVSCTNYSGCGYDWVRPPVEVTRLAKPGNPSGGTFPVGAVNDCSYARRVFTPYCQRGGAAPVQMPASDHAFCKTDRPDYDDVAAGRPDALGYDRTGDVETACVAGARDNSWRPGAWGPSDSTCSSAPTQRRDVQCIRTFNGAGQPESTCAGIAKPATTRTVAADYSSCSYVWEVGQYGAWDKTCATDATRTRTVLCRRSDGAAVADSQCPNPKPAVTESGSNLVGCGYSWSTPTAWKSDSTCSTSTTRRRSTECVRSDGAKVADSYCTSAKPSTVESGYSDLTGCTYTPRDQGKTACTAQGTQQQYWDCTRSDGATGFPASYCNKTNPENVSCTPPPPVYTYTPVNRGETACSNGQKQVYWDCTRNDGATGFPASNCGKTNPETQSCLSYTPRQTGESACSNSQKQVYWDCLGSDGRSYPAANCGKSSSETVSCQMPYTWNWSAGQWGATTGGCPGSSTRTRAVNCVRSDGYADSDQNCNPATRPASSETVACQYTWGWDVGQWGAYNYGCSSSATRTRPVVCRRSDGYADSDQYCNASTRPSSSETGANYASCSYQSEQGQELSSCSGGQKTVALQCRRSDGVLVDNSMCGTGNSKTVSCQVQTTQGRYCKGGREIGRWMRSTSSGYQDPYNGRGPVPEQREGTDSGANCTEYIIISHSEYGTYEYTIEDTHYYAGATGVMDDPYYDGGPTDSRSEYAYYVY